MGLWPAPRPDFKVHCMDGLTFQPSQQQHVVVVDVDCKDPSNATSFPPEPFLTPEFFQRIFAMLHTDGLFILNLACRSPSLYQTKLALLRSMFASVRELPVSDTDINVIVFAFK